MLRSLLEATKKHFFPIIIVLMTILLVSASFLRFMVEHDYLVSFEGDCDPYTQSCYEDCEDDECTEMYYYSVIERSASEVYALCDTQDVSECDAAYECQPDVEYCEVYFCDPEEDGEDVCVSLTEEES